MSNRMPKIPDCYVVPEGRLNTYAPPLNEGEAGIIPKDSTYQNGSRWLCANAKRFHFTDEQIIAAAVPEVIAPAELEWHVRYVVYFLVKDRKIVYVGQTKQLDFRIFQHKEDGCKDFDGIAWVEVPELFLSWIEGYYIHRCKTKYNAKSVPSYEFGVAARLIDKAIADAATSTSPSIEEMEA